MSQNVEFILSLEDKQFTASIDRAGKLLTRFGEQVTKPAQKIQTFERSLGSVARIIGVLESKLDSTADKLQDVAAGFELASDATRKMRGNITSLNSGLKALIERVDTTTSSVDKLTVKWFTEFGHLNRGDMLTSEQHRCHNEKKKFQRRV
ncbi:hypothetical protein UG58_25085 [Escherichia coli O25b:H4-ST131]|nr:hypothetical protein UG58_25085 [Escherichia coli O25b:H4-ST131]